MKSLNQFIKESNGGSVKIVSDLIEIEIPVDKINKLAKKLEKVDLASKTLEYRIKGSDLGEFIVPCQKIWKSDEIEWAYNEYGTALPDHYYLRWFNPKYKGPEGVEYGEYVWLLGCENLYVDDKKIDDNVYKSIDKNLDAYAIYGYDTEKTPAIIVKADPQQIALLLLLDASVQTQEYNDYKEAVATAAFTPETLLEKFEKYKDYQLWVGTADKRYKVNLRNIEFEHDWKMIFIRDKSKDKKKK